MAIANYEHTVNIQDYIGVCDPGLCMELNIIVIALDLTDDNTFGSKKSPIWALVQCVCFYEKNQQTINSK